MIYGGLNRLSEHLEASLTLCVCEIDPLNFYNPPRRFAEDKTDSPHFYTSPTRFAVVQTHFRCSSYTLYGSPNPLPNLLQASYTLCGCQNELLQPPTHMLWGSQNRLSYNTYNLDSMRLRKLTHRSSTSLLHGLRKSKPTLDILQASYTLFESQNDMSELLQASYTRCGRQNGLSDLLQTSYTLHESQSPTPQTSTSLLHDLQKYSKILKLFIIYFLFIFLLVVHACIHVETKFLGTRQLNKGVLKNSK